MIFEAVLYSMNCWWNFKYSWFQIGYCRRMFCKPRPDNKWQLADAYYHINIYRCSFWWMFDYNLMHGPQVIQNVSEVQCWWKALWVQCSPNGTQGIYIFIYLYLYILYCIWLCSAVPESSYPWPDLCRNFSGNRTYRWKQYIYIYLIYIFIYSYGIYLYNLL